MAADSAELAHAQYQWYVFCLLSPHQPSLEGGLVQLIGQWVD